MNKKLLFISLLLVFSFFNVGESIAGTSDNVSGWAWSDGIGWISFNGKNCDPDCSGSCTSNGSAAGCPPNGTKYPDYGVKIDLVGNFSGYAWSENIGWISFEPDAVNSCPSGGTCRARLNMGSYKASGWARACSVFNDKVNCNDNSGQGLDRQRGGWDGWINLSSKPRYEVFVDKKDNEFKDWAWGDNINVGWISFNHRNCDANNDTFSDDSPPGCPGTNIVIPEYKVIFGGSANDPTDLKVTEDNEFQYCGEIHSSNPPVSFTWQSLNQKGYVLEIYEGANLAESSCVVGGCCGNNSCGGSSQSYTAQRLEYGKSYTWRLRIWDNSNNTSNWVNGPAFDTIEYPYPNPDFEWVPAPPEKIIVKEPVTFTTKPGTFSNPAGGRFRWDFGDGKQANSPNSVFNHSVTHVYSAPSSNPFGYEITLTATDRLKAKDRTCKITKFTRVLFPPPIWMETRPPSK